MPCPAFSVVWLPKATLHEATVVKQSHIMAVGLARNGDRYGVRTRAADAAAIHAAVRPGVPFMGGSVKHVYEVGPLPFGTQRESLQKWLDEWKWCARPLQAGSVSPDRSGVMWKVQASSEPPSATTHLAHRPVVITQVPTKPIAEPTAVPVVAHSRTMQVMKGAPAPVGEDPWLKGDPWLQARGVTAAAAHPPAPSVPNLEEQVAIAVQARLDRSVQAMQVDAGMQQHSADDAHHRITKSLRLKLRMPPLLTSASMPSKARCSRLVKPSTGLRRKLMPRRISLRACLPLRCRRSRRCCGNLHPQHAPAPGEND